MRLLKLPILSFAVSLWLTTATAHATVEFDFIPYSAAHRQAAETYRRIWNEYGQRIIEAFESRTCLRFAERSVTAVIADGVSHSGGPAHPMQLRASYRDDMKKATLVHELGHRHLWQLAERPQELDGHQTLFLVLDLVWADIWGAEFALAGVEGESGWRAAYDYAATWAWARSLTPLQRADLWSRLMRMNGFDEPCAGISTSPEARTAGP